jgi:hypothetical protein
LLIPEDISLANIAARIADERKNVAVVFCNTEYERILDNWLIAVDQLGQVPVLVVALDEPLAKRLRREGVPTIHAPCDEKLTDIWAVRAKVLYELVAAGYNVIHSDADAVWLKDPRPLLATLEGDIVSSQGTVYPPSCHEAWVHVLCYGFIQFRATEATVQLLKTFANQAAGPEPFDDQSTLNERLLDEEISWDVEAPYQVPFRGREFTCSAQPIVGETGALRVVVLPHSQVQRFPNSVESDDGFYVRHPLSPKTAEGTEAVLRGINCWYIVDVAAK